MPITTEEDGQRKILVRYKKGTCVEGVDYGPEHTDEPVYVRAPMARLHVDHLQRAEYVEEDEELEGAGESESDSTAETGESETSSEEEGEDADEGEGEGLDLPFELGNVKVDDLPEALADVDDVEALHALQEIDTRSTATPHYEQRLEELEKAGESEE